MSKNEHLEKSEIYNNKSLTKEQLKLEATIFSKF